MLVFHGEHRLWTADGPPFRRFTDDEAEIATGQVQDALAIYEAALAPAGRPIVQALVAMLSAAFPPAKGTDADAAMKLEVYADALEGFPADMLAESARAALRRCRFFPSVAELLGAGEADAIEVRLTRRFKARNDLARLLKTPMLPMPSFARLGTDDGPWPC